MKKVKLFMASVIMAASMSITALAGQWKSDSSGWWYQNDDGSYPVNQWQEIDGKEYYFGEDGYMLANTTTPDGYQVGADGTWAQLGNGDNVENVVTSSELSFEEKEKTFLKDYSGYLDSIISCVQSKKNKDILDEMEKFKYGQMLQNLPSDSYCYPSKDGTGLKIQNDYLYCGELVDGNAEGNGDAYRINVSKSGKGYKSGHFWGEWKNDAPNGKGEEWLYGKNQDSKVHNIGTYVDWYQDGDMTSINFSDGKMRTYHYKVADKLPVGIDKKINGNGQLCTVVAYPEEESSGYLTFYDSAQTALHVNIEDGNRKNNYGYWTR